MKTEIGIEKKWYYISRNCIFCSSILYAKSHYLEFKKLGHCYSFGFDNCHIDLDLYHMYFDLLWNLCPLFDFDKYKEDLLLKKFERIPL